MPLYKLELYTTVKVKGCSRFRGGREEERDLLDQMVSHPISLNPPKHIVE